MAERTADVPPDRRIVLRMGINLGDIIKDGRDIYGDGVNIAARLEALAEPGGICVSQVVRDQVRDKFRIGRGFDHRRRAVGPNRTGNGTDLDPDGLHRRGAVVPRCAPQLCRRLRRVISYDHQQNRLVLAGGLACRWASVVIGGRSGHHSLRSTAAIRMVCGNIGTRDRLSSDQELFKPALRSASG